MGAAKHYPEEAPVHKRTVEGFWMDKYTVTNDQFCFVQATGYVTLAERRAEVANCLGAKPELLQPSSIDERSSANKLDQAQANKEE